MKNILTLVLVLVVLFSCNKENDDSSSSTNSLFFKLNGEQYESNAASGFKNEDIEIIPNVNFNNVGVAAKINGLPFSLFEIIVNDENIPTERSYERLQGCSNIEPNCIFILFSKDATDDDESIEVGNGDNSTINVDFTKLEYNINGRLVGTFSASGFDEDGNEIEITDGSFDTIIN